MLTSFLFLLATVFLTGCEHSDTYHVTKFSGATMGTSYHISVVSDAPITAQQKLKTLIDQRLVRVNQQMSTYIPDSELSLLNQNNSTDWQTLSPALFEVIEISDTISRLSNGAFDVTIGPLIELWGFGATVQEDRVPADDALEKAQQGMGYHHVQLDRGNSRIKRAQPVDIDLSAVAKGYGVDVVAELIEEQGYQNYLVEIGGEIRLKGHNGKGAVWRIGIEKPSPSLAQTSRTAVAMTDIALATSGDYRNYFEVDGKRYSHTIDPRTARPITHQLVSVTVLAETAAAADAWATAFNVMGVETALPLANSQEVAAFFIIKDGEQLRDFASQEFKPYLDAEQ